MSEVNYYSLLAVSRSASVGTIKASYRKLSLQYHPDSGGTNEKMVLLNQAYDVLSDPHSRRKYDEKHRSQHQSETHSQAPRPQTYTSTKTNDFVFVRKQAYRTRPKPTTNKGYDESVWEYAHNAERRPKVMKDFLPWFGVSMVVLGFFVYQVVALFQPPASKATTGIATAPTATTSPAPTANTETPVATTPDIASSTTDFSTTGSNVNTVNATTRHHYTNR